MEDLKEDIKFIVDETLDFGGLSPSDSHEEEDITVLLSPEKPLRRGLSHRSNPNAVAPALQGVRFSLGPLSPEKLEEILDEANRLAAQLEACALQDRESAAGTGPGRPSPRGKANPRRETFVLKYSPVRDLLPTVSSWSTPPPSSLTGLRSSDKKGSARAVRAASGKKPSSIKKESPTCNLFSASKSPGRSPLAQPTLPPRRKTGSGTRTAASPPVRPAPQSSASSSQCSQGAAAKSSSRLPVPSAPKPATRVPLTGRSIAPGKGALAPDSLSTRRGHPSATGHRAPVSHRTNLPTTSAARGRLQPLRKAAVPGATR
ncbi:proline/serine-rich coiled-coil protein 1 isoform X2 [Apodemus sylvaticus]|uniref:proline/serine-rich coiled-coil protein 1 isoform X1 n=1 Tax=Apodemus sylvaticus TaxID=10129 RepID=UPI002244306D|nr:proline/serine-rich coiled-coil protein 1 isoform X1 [Apodemus sylvaticus]XP_052035401.1 proline/serine-rich coiled-coil protein 1 isoform X1 [Apodemus sylvaticus]XP_052035402.1 proline/serine-rich coiled-coil protein 1 isoform X2 [Apodemus sylvaticus]